MNPWPFALAAGGGAALWLATVARPTWDYLMTPLIGSVTGLANYLLGSGESRDLFRNASGQVLPAWERWAGVASVILVMVVLFASLPLLWRHYRFHPLVAVLAALAALYPVAVATQFTRYAANVGLSFRSATFTFIGIALLGALVLAAATHRGRWLPARHVAAVAAATVFFVGSVSLGWAAPGRYPGPYAPATETRSIDPQILAAMDWLRAEIGVDQRVAADRTTAIVVGGYGGQDVVSEHTERIPVWAVFTSESFTDETRSLIIRSRIRYAIVDRRLTLQLPVSGFYYEEGEIANGPYREAIEPEALAKFDDVPGISTIYDSGAIRIYDLSRLELEAIP